MHQKASKTPFGT